jgi:NAD(P)-dependent dehydrogenase (short-subunit alcohol dehydrogenase family)
VRRLDLADLPDAADVIDALIASLCSPDARWTTGASFVVDGGFLLVNPSARPDDE